jgi:hypothetical protein
MKRLVQKANELKIMADAKVQAFRCDVAGSDTTEKIGMVVVAVVIVGLLAAAVNSFMPEMFNSIGNMAQEKLMNIFG